MGDVLASGYKGGLVTVSEVLLRAKSGRSRDAGCVRDLSHAARAADTDSLGVPTKPMPRTNQM